MITIALRTLIVYVFLMVVLRSLGKRQVGQMQVEELVTALLLSELVAFPIAEPDIPLIYAAVPVLLIVFSELLISCLCALFPRFKKLVEGAPAVLIIHGKLNKKAFWKCRIAPDELLAQLRLKDVPDITLVDYAILEQSGQLSVVLKSGIENPQSAPLSLPLVINGRVNSSALGLFGIPKKELGRRLKGKKITDILLYTVTEQGKEKIIMKDGE